MNISIKAGDVSMERDWQALKSTLASRAKPKINFKVDLENSEEMDLAVFNQLVVLYANLRRSGAVLSYSNFSDCVRKYVDKTNFQHVFSGK